MNSTQRTAIYEEKCPSVSPQTRTQLETRYARRISTQRGKKRAKGVRTDMRSRPCGRQGLRTSANSGARLRGLEMRNEKVRERENDGRSYG